MLTFVRSISLLLCLLAASSRVHCISTADLYPHDGLHTLPQGDDEAAELKTDPPIQLYAHKYDEIFVNTNGLLSFERDIKPYRSDFEIPFDYFFVIAPFYADVDTSVTGTITYGKSTDAALLERAEGDIQAYFPKHTSFRPRALYIFTWIDVGYYNGKSDQKNTFQAVLAADGLQTFAFFLYPEDGLNWYLGDDKEGAPGTGAQVGFSSMERFYELPGSKTHNSLYLTRSSNVEVDGVWAFVMANGEGELEDPAGVVAQAPLPEDHYPYEHPNYDHSEDHDHHDHHEHHGDRYEENEDHEEPYHQPYPETEEVSPYDPRPEHYDPRYPDPRHPDHHQPDPHHPDHHQPKAEARRVLETCSTHGQNACGDHANCQDYPSGFCCQCSGNYFGNGLDCLLDESKLQFTGEILGVINDEMLPSTKVNFYVLFKDGRSFTSISNVPDEIKAVFVRFPVISTILGFLFGLKDDSNAKRGFEYTGGKLNRIVEVEFDDGHRAEVRQMLTKGEDDKFVLITEITGTVSLVALTPKTDVEITPVEYTKTETGKFSARNQHTFTNADGSRTTAYIVDSITFEECTANPSHVESILVTTSKAEVKVQEKDSSIRFPITSHISAGRRAENPCDSAPCGANGDCEVVGHSYTCKCHAGFTNQGEHCVEEARCEGEHCGRPETGVLNCGPAPCHPYAKCQFDFELYHYHCKCQEGYEGDGIRTCNVESLDPCRDLYCDPRAECVVQDGYYQCVCPTGTYGDGQRCEYDQIVIEEEDCSRNRDLCHHDAICDYDYPKEKYVCSCKPGFSGDGRYCTSSEEPTHSCRELNNCDPNAECAFNQHSGVYKCVCKQGFYGDGMQCLYDGHIVIESEDCSVKRDICDANADCDYNYQASKYVCTCKPGFEGDGRYCARLDCGNDPRICDRNAHCQQLPSEYRCVCNHGFVGDGIHSCVSHVDHSITDNVIFAQGTYLGQVPSQKGQEGHAKLLTFKPGSIPVAVDVDCAAQKLYWTDIQDRSIHSSKIDGTDSKVIVSKLDSPEGVAIDWVAGNIYWTDTGRNKIQVAREDGSNIKTLFERNITNPRSIVVDPVRGLIFWTDWNLNNPKIESSNLDGSDRKVLVDSGLKLPNGLALDYESQFVCWADAGTHKIECVTYAGRNRRVVAEDAGFTFGLAYHNENFYWTDWKDKAHIKRAGKHSTDAAQLIDITPGVSGKIYDLSVVKATCPHGTNPCGHRNGGCEFLCFASLSGGRTCGCSDGVAEYECDRSTMHN